VNLDDNECLTSDVCSVDSECVNTMGSYFCLPSFVNTAHVVANPLLGTSGGDAVQVALKFEPGTTFNGLNTTIHDQYQLTQLQYGPTSAEYFFTPPADSLEWDYDINSGELLFGFNTTTGHSNFSNFTLRIMSCVSINILYIYIYIYDSRYRLWSKFVGVVNLGTRS